MTQPTLVLMAGLSGTGKTTLAQALGSVLKWPVIDKDVLMAKIFRVCEDISDEKAGMIAYEQLFALARDFVVRQQFSVILDSSAAYSPVIEQSFDIIQEANARLKIILCKADSYTRQVRIEQRNKSDRGRRQLPVNKIIEDDEDRFRHLFTNRSDRPLVLDTLRPLEQYKHDALCHVCEEYFDDWSNLPHEASLSRS